jgi:hypothetical protein
VGAARGFAPPPLLTIGGDVAMSVDDGVALLIQCREEVNVRLGELKGLKTERRRQNDKHRRKVHHIYLIGLVPPVVLAL